MSYLARTLTISLLSVLVCSDLSQTPACAESVKYAQMPKPVRNELNTFLRCAKTGNIKQNIYSESILCGATIKWPDEQVFVAQKCLVTPHLVSIEQEMDQKNEEESYSVLYQCGRGSYVSVNIDVSKSGVQIKTIGEVME